MLSTKKNVPLGISAIQKLAKPTEIGRKDSVWNKMFILFMTFIIYTCYHLSRKPWSVVKNVFTRNCSTIESIANNASGHNNNCHWAPFDGPDAKSLLGLLDFCFTFSYAFTMFLSGFIAERMNLRYFLTLGMVLSGIGCSLLGLVYYYDIHAFWYFVVVQLFSGLVQSTGWPAVVTVMGNWFGENKNGIIFGIWNSHTSVGNILGTLLASTFSETNWALSFIVPGAIMVTCGIFSFLFLMTQPSQNGASVAPTVPVYNKAKNSNGNSFYPIASDSSVTTIMTDTSTSNENSHADAKERHEVRPILSGSTVKAVGFIEAFKTPGVIEFSLCLFFAKSVCNTFLYWLPNFIMSSTTYGVSKSADISTLFDVGGIVGGIIAGALSDSTGMSAFTCFIFLFISIPTLYTYYAVSASCAGLSIALLMVNGALVNGPYALITTSVSAKLGLEGNKRSLSTITSIIDGTGSIGSAVGPLLAGLISNYGWQYVFYSLMISNAIAMLMLVRLAQSEIVEYCRKYTRG